MFARAHAAERMDATRARDRPRGTRSLCGRPPSAAAGPGLARSRPRTVVPVDVELVARPPAAAHHGAQRRRQDDRAQDAGAVRAHGPGRLPRAGRRGLAAAGLRAPLRDHRRRAVGGREPLDLLGLREADPRGAGRGRRPLARAASTSWAPAPIPTRAPPWPRRSSRSWPTAARWWWPPPTSSRSARSPPREPRARNASVEFDTAHAGADLPAALRRARARATRSPSPAGSGSSPELIARAQAHRSDRRRAA